MTETGSRTGVLIIAHGALAQEMLNTLEFITGPQPRARAIALDHALDVDRARAMVVEAIDALMTPKGVLVLTDLFGGAPSNIALSTLDEKNIEIVAGGNLPILIHAVSLDEALSLRAMAEALRDYGRNNIFRASDFFSGKK